MRLAAQDAACDDVCPTFISAGQSDQIILGLFHQNIMLIQRQNLYLNLMGSIFLSIII